jgi:energy-coupling factor transporter ATP-binding protein EcfA2
VRSAVGTVMGDDDLLALAGHLDAMTFALSGPAAAALRDEGKRIARLLRGVVTRTAEPRAPLLVVVGGGSGAGKSTTVNTLAGVAVTSASAIRPTTRIPTLVCHPDDRAWFDDPRVLPELPRDDVRGSDPSREPDTVPGGAPRRLRLAVSDQLPRGIGLLDTPDIDSVEIANHRLADEALDAADGWVWLATSRTYADEVGMTYLRRARARQALTAVAVTQVRPHEHAEVLADVDRLLASEGIDPALRTQVPHVEVADGRLPADAVAELRNWLAALAPTDRRVEVRQQAATGLRSALPAELTPLRDAVVQEQRAAQRLTRLVDDRYAELPHRLDAELEDGISLRADVLDRWQRLVGGNEAMLRVQTVLGQVGDLVRSGLGRPTQEDTAQVRVEVAGELTRIVTRLLETTGRAVRRDLEGDLVGRDLLDANPALRREDPDLDLRVRTTIDGWEDHVAELIETVGGPRKEQARRRSTALNAVATTAILVLFALSGGLTGGEVGIAAAASAASQWLLVRMLGEQNVKRLLEDIGAELTRRVEALAHEDRRRFDRAIATASPSDAAHEALRTVTGAGS